jgi:Tfp pilus assembly pilus retraction ATPase PilT
VRRYLGQLEVSRLKFEVKKAETGHPCFLASNLTLHTRNFFGSIQRLAMAFDPDRQGG